MAILDLTILVLHGTALVFAIIELGITASIVYGSTLSFLVFASVWSILVSGFLLATPFIFRTRNGANDRNIGFASLVLNTLTMIFWLAGFAALSSWFRGFYLVGILGAALAFGVMLWLIYLALTILNFLTAFGILQSHRPGHNAVFRTRRGPTTTTTSTFDVPKV